MGRKSLSSVRLTTGTALGICLFISSQAAEDVAKEPVQRPNIVLVMADDQGWGDVGYNGHPVLKTPNLDKMAAEGLRFDRFYAAAPVSSPTRASVLTGRHPNRMGCFQWGDTLRPQEVTLAERLMDAGYATAHFGKWHLGSVQKGSPVNPGESGFEEWLSAPNFYDNDPILSREGTAVQIEGESSMVAVDAALAFIRDHSTDEQPFLAVVWFGSPHLPHEAAEQDKAMYPDQTEKMQNFYGEITGMDRAIGKLRNELREMSIHDNTVFWYCSDNGGLPGVGSTGGRGRKSQLYEGGLRVPAIIEWPDHIKNSCTTDLPCNTSDIYPTIIEIAGIEDEHEYPLDGISLVPLIDDVMTTRTQPMGFWQYPASGTKTPSREWMAELLEVQKQGQEITDESRLRLDAAVIDNQYPEDEFPGHAAWLDWPWKLHRITEDETEWELYNLEEDPMEESNVVAEEPARVNKMQEGLKNWQQSVVSSLNGKDY